MQSIQRHKFVLSALAFFLVGIGTGTLFDDLKNAVRLPTPINSSVRLGGYQYINPLLECEYSQELGNQEYKPSRRKVEDLLASKKEQGEILHAAVYYRDLNNGPWFGINEKDPFSPASLLKLPVLMAYLKEAEKQPELLKQTFVFEKGVEDVVAQDIPPQEKLELNKSYTVEDLLTRMIMYSDNNALYILENHIDNKLIDKITTDLGIETPTAETPEDFMSVKSYASLFRILYNASYLNKEMSEKALTILTKTKLKAGIGAGIPSSIIIAHKFGERQLADGVKQLHDCSIIYTKRPYLLCIMTRGHNFQNLLKTIGEISYMIYLDMQGKHQT